MGNGFCASSARKYFKAHHPEVCASYGRNNCLWNSKCEWVKCIRDKQQWKCGRWSEDCFADADEWGKETKLRKAFEEMLAGPEMEKAMGNYPQPKGLGSYHSADLCCIPFGCHSHQNHYEYKSLADYLTVTFCKVANEMLLNKEGYSCKGYYWVEDNEEGHDVHYLSIGVACEENKDASPVLVRACTIS